MLGAGDADALAAAARALGNLAAFNAANKEAIAKAGGIAALVTLVRDGTDAQKENAALALRSLTVNNADNNVALAQAGGIAPLVKLLRGSSTDAQVCISPNLARARPSSPNLA